MYAMSPKILIVQRIHSICMWTIKFIYSEKAKIFCEISTIDLSYVVTVKSVVDILQNFVAFSEYMNFKIFCGKKNYDVQCMKQIVQ